MSNALDILQGIAYIPLFIGIWLTYSKKFKSNQRIKISGQILTVISGLIFLIILVADIFKIK